MRSSRGSAIKALTLDLDDTLWPVWPAIERAEVEVHDWLARHAPATAARFDVPALRTLREVVAIEHPEWGHDFTRMRLESLVRALTLAGDDPALAEPAFEVFFAGRNRVELFDEVPGALAALAARWPIVALTNGNADLHGIGLAAHFTATVSARGFGIAKPDTRIFHEACRHLAVAPHEVLHIGDDWALDVVGAHRAGLRTAWVRRDASAVQPSGVVPDCVVSDLTELHRWLIG
jgi:FMN hydrolase / 5-amino-6-(5-phospho-D-ribitylamino)uracil phosphatase